jgi:glucose uptake protein GlcU
MARNSMSLKSLIKTGFGIGIGVSLSQMIFLLVGLAFFIPGYLMYSKKSDKNDSGSKTGGIILMVVGVVLMGGLGFGTLLDSLGDD